MKNLKIDVIIISLVVLSACSFGRRHSTIVENSDGRYLKIEYSGHVYFNEDRTAIRGISPGGYLNYEYNEKRLKAKNDRSGGIIYELYDNGERLPMDDNGKKFVAEAVKVMLQKVKPGNW